MPNDSRQARNESGDLACTRCRERKIRCNREKPACSSCERENDALCVYQIPTKRVNHIKLLCDSVDHMQDRLTTIQSHLARLDDAISVPGSVNARGSSSFGGNAAGADSDESDEDDSGDESDDNSRSSGELFRSNVFRSQGDMAGHYYGHSSIFRLCNRIRERLKPAEQQQRQRDQLHVAVDALCETAGRMEPFPVLSDQSMTLQLPQEQVLASVEYFFRHLDYSTDIFVEENLMQNLRRIYTEPKQPQDEVWLICFRAIVLLVLGTEMASQDCNLFGNFARAFLPSHAGLVSPRLLMTPRLINVQALILLSAAAQHFDPAGWGELIFAYACTLAKTIGLHHHHKNDDPTSYWSIERAKVIRALYARDKSLSVTRGCLPCFTGNEGEYVMELSKQQYQNSPPAASRNADRARYGLSSLQDRLHRLLDQMQCQRKGSGAAKFRQELARVEKSLTRYAEDCNVFHPGNLHPTSRLLQLEFLSTRILATQYGNKFQYREQLLADTRISCVLLLIAHGDNDPRLQHVYEHWLSPRQSPGSQSRRREASPAEAQKGPFTTVLEAFSVSAFFILLVSLLQQTADTEDEGAIPDTELLHKVSAVYLARTGRLQDNCYHRKVSSVFIQLLAILDIRQNTPQVPPCLAPEAQMVPMSTSGDELGGFGNDGTNFSYGAFDHLDHDLATLQGLLASPGNSGMSWDQWLATTSSIDPKTPASTSRGSISGNGLPAMFGSLLDLQQGFSESLDWMDVPEVNTTPNRKRMRQDDGSYGVPSAATSSTPSLTQSPMAMPFA